MPTAKIAVFYTFLTNFAPACEFLSITGAQAGDVIAVDRMDGYNFPLEIGSRHSMPHTTGANLDAGLVPETGIDYTLQHL